MKEIDYKHIAFHIIIALYFIWLVVFSTLVVMILINTFQAANSDLNNIFATMLLLNVLMGTALYLVFRLFKAKSLVSKIINYSYGILMFLSVATLIIIKLKVK